MSDMLNLLDLAKAQNAKVTETEGGDLIATSGQIRLVNGQRATMLVDDVQTFLDVPQDNMRFTRLQTREQNGMIVLQATITMLGEKIGFIGPDGTDILLAAYADPKFTTTWGTWVHVANVEFMRPDEDAVKAIQDYVTSLGWVNFVPRPRNANAPQRERTSTILFDMEPAGNTVTERHANAPVLQHVVLLPDNRDAPNWTSYVKTDPASGEEKSEERWGFTSFVDSVMFNTEAVLAAAAIEPGDDSRSEKQATARSRMSVLTGINPDTPEGYSLRPTLGYLSFKPVEGAVESSIAGGMEIRLFPPRNAQPTVETTTTTETSDVEEDLFSS